MTAAVASAAVARVQRNLAKLGLYLGKLDGLPGPMTCDAFVHLLAGVNAPPTGPALALAMPLDWWDHPCRVNTLLAMVYTECGFRPVQEDLRYSAERLVEVWPNFFGPGRGHDPAAFAGNPIGLANLVYGGRDGNFTPTDGWTYRGRGWPQLTGRANYRAYSDAAGINLEVGPDAMLRLDVSARVTVAFMRRTLGLLNAADEGDVERVRFLWNGGANGLAVAQAAYAKLTTIWDTP